MSGMSGWAGGFQQPLALQPDVVSANMDLVALGVGSGGVIGTALLVPTFQQILLPGIPYYSIDTLAVKVTALEAATTVGAAIYSVTMPSDNNLNATLVGQLNATFSGAATGVIRAKVTTGASGSGAAPVLLDMTQNRYFLGSMASSVTTLALLSVSFGNTYTDLNVLKWTAAARSSTTDWPASFTQASVGTAGTARIPWVGLMTANGALAL